MEQSQKDRLIAKGRKVPVDGVLQQGRTQVQLCRNHEAVLADYGWPRAKTDYLDQQIFALDALFSGRSQQVEAALRATIAEAVTRHDAKSFIRRLRTAVPLALQDAPVEGVTENAFNTGEHIGRSTPKISKYLMTVRPFVEKLDTALSKYLGGKSPLQELEAVKTALDTADAVQESGRAGLPEETANIYQLSGEILTMIETVNRIAKIAFDGSAEIIGQFNKDLTLRGRRSRKQTSANESDEASGM
jgi:hypothetical protein